MDDTIERAEIEKRRERSMKCQEISVFNGQKEKEESKKSDYRSGAVRQSDLCRVRDKAKIDTQTD